MIKSDPSSRSESSISITNTLNFESLTPLPLIAHVRSRGEEAAAKKAHKGGKARRWVVEVAHSWFNRFRKLLVRYEKTLSSYLALMHLAASIICWRKIGVIYGINTKSDPSSASSAAS